MGQCCSNVGVLLYSTDQGKSSESVQCAMLKACDACADMGPVIAHCTDSEDFP